MHEHGSAVSRRELVRRGAAAAAAAVLVGLPGRASAEPPPETTKLRLVKEPSICIAPQYAAEQLLKAEGFVDIES